METQKCRVCNAQAFFTISTSLPILSSPSLSRSIAVWKVNFPRRAYQPTTHPFGVNSHLHKSLPVRNDGFTCPQGCDNPWNILNPFQLTVHYVCDVNIFRAGETPYSIVAGIYDFKGERGHQEPRPKQRTSQGCSCVVQQAYKFCQQKSTGYGIWGWNSNRITIVPLSS